MWTLWSRSQSAANYRLNIDVVKPRASIAIYANDGGGDVTLDVRQNMIKNLRYQFVLLYTVGDAALTAAVEDITSALMDEALPVGADAGLPLHRFPLETRQTPTKPSKTAQSERY